MENTNLSQYLSEIMSLDKGASHLKVTPGRYVGSEAAEDDDETFWVKLSRLVVKRESQFSESDKLTTQIRKNQKLLGETQK